MTARSVRVALPLWHPQRSRPAVVHEHVDGPNLLRDTFGCLRYRRIVIDIHEKTVTSNCSRVAASESSADSTGVSHHGCDSVACSAESKSAVAKPMPVLVPVMRTVACVARSRLARC